MPNASIHASSRWALEHCCESLKEPKNSSTSRTLLSWLPNACVFVLDPHNRDGSASPGDITFHLADERRSLKEATEL